MVLLAVGLLLLGILMLCIGSVWLVVNSFRVSVFWGFVLLFFSPAWIRFAWCHWDMAKRPFFSKLLGVALVIGGFQLMPASANGEMAELVHSFEKMVDANASKKKAQPPVTFAGQQEAEVKLKLAALAQKENDLRARKAAIDPKNREAAAALVEEIKQYNAELQPVLQQQRELQERGLLSAAK